MVGIRLNLKSFIFEIIIQIFCSTNLALDLPLFLILFRKLPLINPCAVLKFIDFLNYILASDDFIIFIFFLFDFPYL